MTETRTEPAQRVALLAGVTGLTGAALLQRLLATGEYSRVHALTRRILSLEHPRLANRVVKFEEQGARLPGVRADDAFCCIGAPAGPRARAAELQRADVGAVLSFARLARASGVTRLVVLSAAGADRNATSPFLKAKGEMEAALRELDFASLDILQPGAVVGARQGEGATALLRQGLQWLTNPLRAGKLAATRAISGQDLAAAMLGAARSRRRGTSVHAGLALAELAVAGKRSA